MQLLDIYSTDYREAVRFLYQMLKNRDPVANISHKKMPTLKEHRGFVDSHPYEAWYIILDDTEMWIGSCYLSKQNEIGIHIKPLYQKHGYGTWAVKELMRLHGPRRYLANIAAGNERSQDWFDQRLGFMLISFTYEKDTRDQD